MSFAERIAKSQEAVNAFDDWCDANGIVYAKTGYEDLSGNNPEAFRQKIQKLNGETAKRLRFFPDRAVVLNNATLVEIKHSKYIEKDAYDTYQDLNGIHYSVGIVFLNDGRLLFVHVAQLELVLPAQCNIPIVDTYWIAPRLLDEYRYAEWKARHKGSGTTYGIVDFDSTPWKCLSP